MGSYKYGGFCFTRKFRWTEAEPPPDVKRAFDSYADGAGGAHMTADGLRRFLAEGQGDCSVEAADADLFVGHLRRLEHHRHHRLGIVGGGSSSSGRASSQPQPLLLGVDHFHQFLFSEDLNPPIGSQVHQEMTAPLSHYYIYTGHNSYLTGNQLSSDCSDVPIKEALQRGVRVIELDMWPNSKKNDVDILHGRTLTAPVTLLKCLRTIKEYAFYASSYPVVITLEDHLTPDLQAKVAEMVTITFGDILYYPKLESLEEFPCPEDLKKRIILSTKPPKEYLDSRKSSRFSRGVSRKGKDSTKEDRWGKEVTDYKGLLESDKNRGDQDEEDAVVEGDDNMQQNISLEYRHLITIRAGKPKGQLRNALKVDPNEPSRRLSLSEQELEKAAKDYGEDLIKFTQKNMLRIYPKGTRVDSSNYNPLIGWMHGAQMVAFNMQGHGRALWLMQGLFRANGGCGYVKKPDFLLNVGPYGTVFDPKANLPVEKTLKVKVYMGDGWRMDFSKTHFDTFSPPDFYTRVGIAGVPADTVMKKTRTIEDDWTPVWDEEFTFPLTLPELALLRVEVHEYDRSGKDDFAGQTCLLVSELRPGIRCVPLYDEKGMKFRSVRLLMYFNFI